MSASIEAHAPDVASIADIVYRVRAEFLEMPRLKLTRRQAARLWALEDTICDTVLAALVNERFLACTHGAQFVRAD